MSNGNVFKWDSHLIVLILQIPLMNQWFLKTKNCHFSDQKIWENRGIYFYFYFNLTKFANFLFKILLIKKPPNHLVY